MLRSGVRRVFNSVLALGIVVGGAAVLLPGATAGAAKKATRLTFESGYYFGYWDTGWFVAMDKGFWKKAGLDVKVLPGEGSSYDATLLASGKATIAHIAGSVVATARQKGASLVMVASFFQNGGSGVFGPPGLTSPKQLDTAQICGSPYDYTDIITPAFLKKEGVTGATMVNVTSADVPAALLNGKCKYMADEAWATLAWLKIKGDKGGFLPFIKYGVNPIGPGIVTTQSLLSRKPKLVKRFAEASAKAWAWAYAHCTKAGHIAHKLHKTLTVTIAVTTCKVDATYAHTPATKHDALGWMSPKTWAHMVQVMMSNGTLPSSLNAKTYAKSLYKNVLAKH